METIDAVKEVLTDSNARVSFLERNRLNIILYLLLFGFIFFSYHLLSDGDFSFFLTLGAIIRMFGFVILLAKLRIQKTNEGVSLKTLELYTLVFIGRLSSILVYEGYLPFDKSGDWLYQAVEIASLLLCLATIATILTSHQPYNYDADSFGFSDQLPSYSGPLLLAVGCFVQAIVFHPQLNRNFLTDTLWTFAAYLEVSAILPQFVLLQKQNKPVESWISHFVFSLGLSRVFLFVFWASSFHELAVKRSRFFFAGYEGWMIMSVQVLHLVMMGEFCYRYLRAAKEQTPLVIPSLDV